jgi:hypothetical protein
MELVWLRPLPLARLSLWHMGIVEGLGNFRNGLAPRWQPNASG